MTTSRHLIPVLFAIGLGLLGLIACWVAGDEQRDAHRRNQAKPWKW